MIKESKARQLRISHFKHEGGNFTTLAKCIAKAAWVSVNDLHRQYRGGPGSDARKCFANTAIRKYVATAKAVADYLGIHPTAVSAMVCKGLITMSQGAESATEFAFALLTAWLGLEKSNEIKAQMQF